MKILIAEDDLTSRVVLQAVLEKWGYEVVVAADGHQAWHIMAQPSAPQMIVLDWMMPGIDGAQLCRKLRGREDLVSLYIILLTSKTQKQDIVMGLEAGADDYIAKPFDNQELRARINVGRRMIELQNKLQEREKFQGVLEMAGAVCHELNQPLQVVNGWSEMLLWQVDESDPKFAMLNDIKAGVDRIGALTRKIMSITQYRCRDYPGGKNRIIDLDRASAKSASS